VKLSVVRGGGIAGIATRTEVSTDSLSDEDARTLRAKVDEAGVLRLSADAPARSQHPDDLLYELTVEDEGRVHTVQLSESALPEAVRLLIAWADSRPEAEYRRT
jgi:hypothetical protein